MKQQQLQQKEILITQLQQKIEELRKKRNEYMDNAVDSKKAQGSHIKVADYLKSQGVIQKKQIVMKQGPIVKQQNYINPTKSKADIIRQQKQTRQRVLVLEDLYNKKKQLEIAGIIENNPDKIRGLYQNDSSKQKIQKQILKNKKKMQQKMEKDKIIAEQLGNVKKFLKQAKSSTVKAKQVPEQHISKLFLGNESKKNQISMLLTKSSLRLVEKEKILAQIYEILKQENQLVQKSKLKTFLLSNIQFCNAFYITKNEIMRDLLVYDTQENGYLSYQQFYEFIKSIEITNAALRPNLKYQPKQSERKEKQTLKNNKYNQKLQTSRQMQAYLKKLFIYLDSKHEKVVERLKLELALKKCLLFNDKVVKFMSRNDILYFSEIIEKSNKKSKEIDYYKTLDLKYIGLEQLICLYKGSLKQKSQLTTERNDEQQSQNWHLQQKEQSQLNQNDFQEQPSVEEKFQLNPKLQPQDFQKYGFGDSSSRQVQNFGHLKQLDTYYKEVGDKYGNQIHWNGFDHYRQDFHKFNQCIQEMNKCHKNEKNEKQIKEKQIKHKKPISIQKQKQ